MSLPVPFDYPPSNHRFGLARQQPFPLHEETDYYGFSRLLESLSGKVGISNSRWNHGWEHLPYSVALEEVQPDLGFIITSSKRFRDFLVRYRGKKHVIAGGVPFCYMYDIDLEVARIPGSLLVMPGHMLEGMNVEYIKRSVDEYVGLIRDISANYSTVVFCLHWNCIKTGLWLKELKDSGFSYVVGGRTDDSNSLLRLRQMFQTFESVTTNQIGSHVAYAALAGCSISVHGGYLQSKVQSVFVKRYKMRGRSLYRYELSREFDSQEFLQRLYPFLFVEPQNASVLKSWAEEELGFHIRLPIDQIVELLGWEDPVLQEYYRCFNQRSYGPRDYAGKLRAFLGRRKLRHSAAERFDALSARYIELQST